MVRAAVGALLAMAAGWAAAADWPQWRGPERNGVAAQSPPLIDTFPQGGPKLVWKSGKVPGGGEGGYGSLAVADGLVYAYSNTKYSEPLETRTLSRQALEQLGWSPDMPENLRAKVEEARLSDERAKLEGREAQAWARNWVQKNVAGDQRRFQPLCFRRIMEGRNALPLEVLAKLDTIKDKPFAGQKELEQWFAGNGIADPWKRAIQRHIPASTPLAYDEVFCLDAATGKEVWKARYAGQHVGHSCSSTPCVARGRCYVQGSTGEILCLDAKTGKEIWRVKTKARAGNTLGSSVLVVDGVAVVQSGPLTAIDAETGQVLWEERRVSGDASSAICWRKDGSTYLLCNGGSQTFCLEPKTGKVLWGVPGGGPSTPVVADDVMVVFSSNAKAGLAAYRLSVEAAVKLWSVSFTDRGASPVVHEGHVYAFGGMNKGRAVCVDLVSGAIAWDQKLPDTEINSPVVADGKLRVLVGMGGKASALSMVRATPEKHDLLGELKLPMLLCTSVAFAEGRMFVRLNDAVACYDVRK